MFHITRHDWKKAFLIEKEKRQKACQALFEKDHELREAKNETWEMQKLLQKARWEIETLKKNP